MKPNIKIDDEWINRFNPCPEALEWWDKEPDPLKILRKLIDDKKYQWANWFIMRIMEHIDQVRYAVFAAESVLSIYERQYPDARPRKAILAAKRYVESPTTENKDAAADAAYAAAYTSNAAAYAANAAAYTANTAAYAAYASNAAAYASNAAAYASAYAAAYAATSAVDAVTSAAYASAYAANASANAAAYAANASANAAYVQYLEYGYNLLQGLK